MASNHGGKNVMDSGSSEGTTSATTVEIKIKTLDSQTYTLCVDKCVPVPALKEQIASVTGVLSEQQRLICRGKVLKDDQLLSAYHVEDGHTLHLVARQPINPSLAGFSDHSASDPASNTRHSIGHQHAPSVVVGTFNISDQSDGGMPDFSRIVSAVLGSFGIANAGNGNEADLQQHISERLSRIPGLNEIRSSTDASGRGQSQTNPQGDAFTLPTDVSMESLQLPVIPDSLSTLSQYLRRLRREFNDNVRIQGNNGGGEESYGAPTSGVGQGGLPTPAALGEVMQSARQLLIEQAGECLMQLTRQLGDQTNVNDPVARLRMQSNALRSGALLQNLGAFLLELGRTTMTLRMGQSPSEAVVNAGPAVFISTSGPNPIMVQPLPFQPGASFGATPSGTNFSVGSGLRPRNIDIRIRTGSVLSPAVNQREASGGGERSLTDPPPPPPPPSAAAGAGAGSDSEIAANYVTALRNLTQTRGSDVRVVPIRISEASRSSVGVVYPVVARSHLAPDPPSNEPPSGLDQLLRNLFPGDQNHSQVESSQPAGSSQETPSVNDEGTFLSNLLHQIMPIVSQHIGNADVEDRAAQPSSSVQENNQDRGASSDDPPTSKRQKTE